MVSQKKEHPVIRWIDKKYQRYVESYKAYVKFRGYDNHLNDWPFFKRSFLTCWLEPGFHRFWRTWNPGISYFFFRLYLIMGGKRNKVIATLAAFEASGIAHVLAVYLLLKRWSFVLPVTFLAFGILTLVSKEIESILRQERWPAVINALVNIGLIIVSYDLGFYVNKILCSARLCPHL